MRLILPPAGRDSRGFRFYRHDSYGLVAAGLDLDDPQPAASAYQLAVGGALTDYAAVGVGSAAAVVGHWRAPGRGIGPRLELHLVRHFADASLAGAPLEIWALDDPAGAPVVDGVPRGAPTLAWGAGQLLVAWDEVPGSCASRVAVAELPDPGSAPGTVNISVSLAFSQLVERIGPCVSGEEAAAVWLGESFLLALPSDVGLTIVQVSAGPELFVIHQEHVPDPAGAADVTAWASGDALGGEVFFVYSLQNADDDGSLGFVRATAESFEPFVPSSAGRVATVVEGARSPRFASGGPPVLLWEQPGRMAVEHQSDLRAGLVSFPGPADPPVLALEPIEVAGDALEAVTPVVAAAVPLDCEAEGTCLFVTFSVGGGGGGDADEPIRSFYGVRALGAEEGPLPIERAPVPASWVVGAQADPSDGRRAVVSLSSWPYAADSPGNALLEGRVLEGANLVPTEVFAEWLFDPVGPGEPCSIVAVRPAAPSGGAVVWDRLCSGTRQVIVAPVGSALVPSATAVLLAEHEGELAAPGSLATREVVGSGLRTAVTAVDDGFVAAWLEPDGDDSSALRAARIICERPAPSP